MPLNIVDFATNPEFSEIDLYPVQGTILKVLGGEVDTFTDFDREVIAGWEQGWEVVEDRGRYRWRGSEGTPPGLEKRLKACRDAGRNGPEEVAAVIGRRGSKGLMAAIAFAYLLYRLLRSDGVTADAPVRRGKAIAVLVMGAKLDQARLNAYGDLKDLIENSPAFAPFLGKCTVTSTTLLLPSQLRNGAVVSKTEGLLQVRAVETTPTAGRGPTVIGLLLDEFAHIGTETKPDSATSSLGIYRGLRPATAQFPRSGLVLQTSSPWEQTGQLFESYQLATEVTGPDGEVPRAPSVITIQLPSWATYEHWQRADQIPMWPDGPCFPAKEGPIIERTWLLERFADLDPDGFAVEYGAQFATSVHAYLGPRIMAKLPAPYAGTELEVDRIGAGNRQYFAHGDPGRVNDSFGFAIVHVRHDEHGFPHVFVDDAWAWRATDFPDGFIHYPSVEAEIAELMVRYPMVTLTFDPWNSAGTIDRLRSFAHGGRPRLRTNVFDHKPSQPKNWRVAEVFKAAAMAGLVHIPAELTDALEELAHLQVIGQRVDHPTTGPVTSKDIADAVMWATYNAIGDNFDATIARLASLPLHARPGPRGPSIAPPTVSTRFSVAPLSQDELIDRLGSGAVPPGVGAPRGQGYNPARGHRRGRGENW